MGSVLGVIYKRQIEYLIVRFLLVSPDDEKKNVGGEKKTGTQVGFDLSWAPFNDS